AHAVEQLVDLQRRVAGRPAEQHVLQQVRQARLVVVLEAGPGADPEPERGGSHRVHGLGDDPHARAQLGESVLFAQRPDAALVALGIAIGAVPRAARATRPVAALAAAAAGAAVAVTARPAVAVAVPAAAAALAPRAAAVAAAGADGRQL